MNDVQASGTGEFHKLSALVGNVRYEFPGLHCTTLGRRALMCTPLGDIYVYEERVVSTVWTIKQSGADSWNLGRPFDHIDGLESRV
jgi:hypothetical protein